VPLLFIEEIHETLTDYNNFWRVTSKRNLMRMTIFLATSL